MGIFAPSVPNVPPPPPLPPAANPQTVASGNVQGTAANAKARAAGAAGAGFNGTDITKPNATGATNPQTAKASLLGETA